MQILLSLMVFAVGFVTRPLGGLLFGYIGDKYGRRIALILSMAGMTIPTFVIGLTPSASAIGNYAPAILIVMRLMQGLCISGEGAGAAVFILEHHNHLKPGTTAGIVHGSNILGTLIASVVGIAIESYWPNASHAWRFAFILGGAMGLFGFYLRIKVAETPIFLMLNSKKREVSETFSVLLKSATPSLFLTFCVGGVASSVLYLVKTYVNVFYSNVMHFDNKIALTYLLYASLVSMFFMPLAGFTADCVGKTKTIVASALLVLCLSLPTLLWMSSCSVFYQILALTMLGALGGMISGSAYIFIISLFKPEQRFLGVAFSYNLGIAIFGGTSPIISRWLVEKTHLFYSPAFYIMGTSSVFLLILFLMRSKVFDGISQAK